MDKRDNRNKQSTEFRPDSRNTRKVYGQSAIIEIEEAQRQRQQKRADDLAARRYSQKRARAIEIENARAARKSYLSGKRLVYLVIIAVVIGMIALSGSTVNGLWEKQAEAAQILKDKSEQKAKLSKELAMVNDPAYVEAQARDYLHMIKPGEVLYIFKDNDRD